MSKLTFWGATGQVTGSCYLLETATQRILLDCGLFQGRRETEQQNQAPFPFDPAILDAVILSHAHLDHSGRLPKLYKDGFRGTVFLTAGSYHLLDLMLSDAASLQMRDTEWENKKRQRAGKKLLQPLYTLEDVEQLLKLRKSLNYNQSTEILPGLTLTFYEAGHILGSAIVNLQIKNPDSTKTLVFSGDLGNQCSPLLRDPQTLKNADVLLLESTYGDRDHKPMDSTLTELRAILKAAQANGGNVIIPSFAVGRTQDLIYWLGKLYQEGHLPQQQVFLDSPMAIRASDIYDDNIDLFNRDDPAFRQVIEKGWQAWLPNLNYCESTEDSMRLNQITGGAIIIAGSGMCTGGRIRHHLKYNLWRRDAHIVFVGYQAEGTLGRMLVDGNKNIKLLGAKIAVQANIHTVGGLSAHADQSQLLDWASAFEAPKPRLYLVHGEISAANSLRTCFHRLNWDATLPQVGQTIDI
ncbi:MAG: MBL fold metallo-hydrolase [Gammaproteobacteria bacterium HGW-Gammaproteobacteria-3]|nr:MAG: MBL fold metallo-hydrolase [Gammaproteobacteria bacterium HGW-Gammaproteobacteria-3]